MMKMLFWIIVLIIALQIRKEGKRSENNNSNSFGTIVKNKGGVKQNVCGKLFLLEQPENIIVSYRSGSVFYSNKDGKIGSYDDKGNVYNNNGELIGIVEADHNGSTFIYLDRTYIYNWLRKQLPYDEALNNRAYMPSLQMIGVNYGSFIEGKNGGQDLYI